MPRTHTASIRKDLDFILAQVEGHAADVEEEALEPPRLTVSGWTRELDMPSSMGDDRAAPIPKHDAGGSYVWPHEAAGNSHHADE